MKTQTELSNRQKTNALIYTDFKIIGKNTIKVVIQLDDRCKNGHQDFSITGEIYETRRPETGWISGGCIHDDILKHFPQFAPFVRLHLSDYTGCPMYAVANGFYHMEEGFNDTKPESHKFKSEYCDHYRISSSQFDKLKQCKNKIQFAISLKESGILEQWREEANRAIKQLEELTDKSFVIDSRKTQYDAPTEEELTEERERKASGYYTPEAEAQRGADKLNELFDELKNDLQEKVNELEEEYTVKCEVLRAGGARALNNCIYYIHSRELSFNWRSYEQISDELIADITKKIKLPKGVIITNKKGE